MINYIIIAIITFVAILLGLIFLTLYKLGKYQTQKMKDAIYPKFIELNKTIITVTSGIIALTISFINKQTNREYLSISLVFFGVCIIMSIMILMLQYVSIYVINICSTVKNKNNKTKDKKEYLKDNKILKNGIYEYLLFANLILVCFYIQLVSFVGGFVLLIAFTII